MKKTSGFTLVEISIVLVIIGLIIGGILTGQDLIETATLRSQITQIDKLNTAVRTFQTKYGYLPGDIPNPYATQFGFKTRGNYQGTGNGDGMIAGSNANLSGGKQVSCESSGETVMVWVDLSQAGLIDQGFTMATSYTPPASDITGSALNNYVPQAKIGNGNYLYAYTGGVGMPLPVGRFMAQIIGGFLLLQLYMHLPMRVKCIRVLASQCGKRIIWIPKWMTACRKAVE